MTNETRISVRSLAPKHSTAARWLNIAGPAIDWALGIRTLDAHYRAGRFHGLDPGRFADRALATLGVQYRLNAPLAERIPLQGPVLVVCNHPYGGIEALILLSALQAIRNDVKFLANAALRVFPELAPHIVPTNPLRVTQANLKSIRACEAHLRAGGVLVVFPAGRVSYFRSELRRIADGEWNRIVGHLARRTEAPLLPVFFHGCNRPIFHALGRMWERAKLLMLPREMLALKGRRIDVEIGRAIAARVWRHMKPNALTGYARTMTYLQAAPTVARDTLSRHAKPLAERGDPVRMASEIAALPPAQRLLDFKQFSVFHATQDQIPTVLDDIARERERVFRLYDEGGGEPRDTDRYDATYVQLFAWDNHTRSLVGAYRMGRTDELRAGAESHPIYLWQMFEFATPFYEQAPPALELGRSFIVPEHQKSYHALYLLWQGIGRYLLAHPRYRRLYGTVSLSRQYDDRAIALLCDALIEPSPSVRPRTALATPLHPEWHAFRERHAPTDLSTLSSFVRGLDGDGKDLPILLKHYHKLGAKFICVGVDPNFNDTPGLLLAVDVPTLAPKVLETFLGDRAAEYLAAGHGGDSTPIDRC